MLILIIFLFLSVDLKAMDMATSMGAAMADEKAVQDNIQRIEELRSSAILIMNAEDDPITKAYQELSVYSANLTTPQFTRKCIADVLPLIVHPQDLLLSVTSDYLKVIQAHQSRFDVFMRDCTDEKCKKLLQIVKDFYELFEKKLKETDEKSDSYPNLLMPKVKVRVENYNKDVLFKLITQEMALSILGSSKQGVPTFGNTNARNSVVRLNNVFFKQLSNPPLDLSEEMRRNILRSVAFPFVQTAFIVLKDVRVNNQNMRFCLEIAKALTLPIDKSRGFLLLSAS